MQDNIPPDTLNVTVLGAAALLMTGETVSVGDDDAVTSVDTATDTTGEAETSGCAVGLRWSIRNPATAMAAATTAATIPFALIRLMVMVLRCSRF